jgi:hypothetical protein
MLSLALGGLAVCVQEKADAADSDGAGQVLAIVNGKPIKEAEVRQSAADQFKAVDREYQQSVQQLIENGLEQVVQDRLLDAEAASRKISREELLGHDQAAPGHRCRCRSLLRPEQGLDFTPEARDHISDQELLRAVGRAERKD